MSKEKAKTEEKDEDVASIFAALKYGPAPEADNVARVIPQTIPQSSLGPLGPCYFAPKIYAYGGFGWGSRLPVRSIV